ncbi:hypothetical protein [Polymorphospora sp. NPDC050346]|uniref:hypothetical protein n=1 Tax=Polymorphospora sp. NPDC050346 TaxID=3155780 RepID=UPI0033DAF55B
MGSRPGESRRLGLGAVAELLGEPRLTAWWWHRYRGLTPTGIEDGTPWWSPDDVYAWALAHKGGQLVDRVPVTAWTPNRHHFRAVYGRAVADDGLVVMRWHTSRGRVSVLWPLDDVDGPPVGPPSPLPGDAATIAVTGLWMDGPELTGVLPGIPGRTYPVSWKTLSRVLDQPLPWWPVQMRQHRLLSAWRPGDAPVTTLATADLDTEALLAMAATYEQAAPTARTLVHLARVAYRQAADSAAHDLELLDDTDLGDDEVVVAARPLPVPDAGDVDETVRRAGWLELLDRDDQLAARCVRAARRWNSGKDLPYSRVAEFAASSRWAMEWGARLEPGKRTAAVEVLDPDGLAAVLVDPQTGVPAVRTTDGMIRAAVPQRLPATTPLHQLVLDGPIWIRTADGTLWPAPQDPYYGTSWGYSGSGPASLSRLVDRLLDDINAAAPASLQGAPKGLLTLLQRKWPAGTVLTRQQLEAARLGKPVAVDDPRDEDEDDR